MIDELMIDFMQKALNEANEAKLEGNKLFGEGKYEEALLQYEVALRVASVPERAESASAPEAKEGQSASEKNEVAPAPEMAELSSICHSNRGICFLKLVCYSFNHIAFNNNTLFCLCILKY